MAEPKARQTFRKKNRGTQWSIIFYPLRIFRASRPPAGMSVAAILYRGPAAVRFEPEGFVSVKNAEEMEIKAIFTEPGTYVVRIIASDGMLRIGNNVTLAVGAPTADAARERR